MKKVAILQSNYIPWKGYFDIIGAVDIFVFHDDLQYTKGDWRNRNKIKTPNGSVWLTIPCGRSEDRLICDVNLVDSQWQRGHWRKIEDAYRKAPFFEYTAKLLRPVYLDKVWTNLSDLNQSIIKLLAHEVLGMNTIFMDSRGYSLTSSKGDRVLELLKKINATAYLSGPAAKNYLDVNLFNEAGIDLEWMDYSGYREYPQMYLPFDHGVSIVDMLMNLGPNINEFMLYEN